VGKKQENKKREKTKGKLLDLKKVEVGEGFGVLLHPGKSRKDLESYRVSVKEKSYLLPNSYRPGGVERNRVKKVKIETKTQKRF